MKPFEESDFLVTFTGEAPSARLIRGWDRVLAYLDYEATNRSPEESYRNPDNTGIHNRDSWTHLDCGLEHACGDTRFEFDEGIGECGHVTVTRITTPINEGWVDDKTADLLEELQVSLGALQQQLQDLLTAAATAKATIAAAKA